MYKARYYKSDGKKGRARALPDEFFDGVVNEGVLHLVVKAHLANQRQGTASAKNRAAVAGGSRKPWRQKGTGRARQGTTRAAQWTGGGLAFPPRPHSWRQSVPKKVRALARRSALNTRAEDDRVLLIDGLDFEGPKTSRLVGYLASIEVGGKVLLLTEGTKRNVYLSARNVPGVEVRAFGEESVYDLLWASTVIIEREALDHRDAPQKAAVEAEESAPEAMADVAAEEAIPEEAAPAEEAGVEAEAVEASADEEAAADTEEAGVETEDVDSDDVPQDDGTSEEDDA